LGRIVLSVTGHLPFDLNLTAYPRGVYTLEFSSVEGRPYRGRLLLVD
jgi:hypothetical protein